MRYLKKKLQTSISTKGKQKFDLRIENAKKI